MVLTVTLNPCIDRTVVLEDFQYGALNRVKESRVDIAGKGINVSTVLNNLNYQTYCTGFCFKNDSEVFYSSLRNKGIGADFELIEGNLRTNIKLLNQGVLTELNEKGGLVTEESFERLLTKITTLIQQLRCETLVLSGSVPRGLGTDVYKKIIQRVKEQACTIKTIVLDAEGSLLAEGLTAGPTIIKPNLFELEQHFQTSLRTKEDMIHTARKIIEGGVPYVCVSLGKDGAILLDEKNAYFGAAPSVEIKGLQGAGDSMVAGLCIGLQQQESSEEMLRRALALAAASISRSGTLLATKIEYEQYIKEVKVDKL